MRWLGPADRIGVVEYILAAEPSPTVVPPWSYTASRRVRAWGLKNAYIREDRILPQLPALHLQLSEPAAGRPRRRTRRGVDVRYQASPEDMIGYLREQQITLTYDPASGALDAGTAEAAQTITLTAS